MGCFFNCFRIKGLDRDGSEYSTTKVKEGKTVENNLNVRRSKDVRSPLKQVETERFDNNERITDEIENQINSQKSASKNQLSAVFLREDLEDDNSLEKVEDKKTLEISSIHSPEIGNKHEENSNPYTNQQNSQNTPTIPTKSQNSFIDKHILQQSPNSPLTNPIPPKSPLPNTGTGTETEIPSLSEWLKPPSKERFLTSKSGLSEEELDRPIIGSVAAHWSQSEDSEMVSVQTVKKTWDGKGIPNSTNKYKEDQKVSWHATPFEERLEKALSEEKFLSQRGFSGGIPFEINMEEGEESDTAAS